MKKIYYFPLLFLATLFSCVKLKEKPQSFISSDQFYNTQSDAINAVNAVYFLLNSGGNAVQTPYNTLFSTGMDMMTDDIDPGPGATNPDVRSQAQLLHNSSGLRVLQIWQQHYAGIYKANVAILEVPGINMDGTLKNRLVGESKFLRALYYFNLVRLYGDVPLLTTPTNSLDPSDLQVHRTSSAEVYAQIEKDLTEAADALPTSYTGTDIGRATKGAALALLAKVYLTEASFPLQWTEKYQDAVTTAQQVVDLGVYSLLSEYYQVFAPAYKNLQVNENIFAAQFQSNSQGQGNNQAPRGARKNVPGVTGANYADQVRFYTVPDTSKVDGQDHFFSVYKLFQYSDKRKDSPIINGQLQNGTFTTRFVGSDNKFYGDVNNKANDKTTRGDSVPYLNKWWDVSQASNLSQSAANVPIIRYSELLLILAEAENELSGPSTKALSALNQVRQRANLSAIGDGALSQNQFREEVYLQRRLELVWENQRWFDLIRQKDSTNNRVMVAKLHVVGKTAASDKHYLYPIPLQEIQLNPNLTQNPGW